MTLKLLGSTSGHTAINAPASAGSNTLVLPPNNGTSGQVLQTDGNGNLTWVDQPTNTPAFFAYDADSTSHGLTDNTATKATWLTDVEFNDGSGYNTGTQKFTVPSGKAGRYVVTTGANYYSNGNDIRTLMTWIQKNGSGKYVGQYSLVNSYVGGIRHFQANCLAIINLSVGDYLEPYVQLDRDGSSALYISNDSNGPRSNYFSAYKLIV
tara:strand:- start:274 stop:900 length:627 start_codon:yes stop_codon:yes gene_type:complete